MSWKNGEMFKLKKQKDRCWQACFSWEKYRWVSTREHDEDKAREWCENVVMREGRVPGKGRNILLGQFASGFFSPADPMGYRRRRARLGKDNDEHSYAQRQGWLDNYIMPRFADVALADIGIVMVEDWYVGLESVSKGTLLSSGTRIHVLKTLSMILDEAVRLSLIPFNPCDKVDLIRISHKEKKIFTDDQLHVLFPPSPVEMIAVWGDVQTALFFSIAIDTGWRAGEIMALCSDAYYPEVGGVYSTRNVNTAIGLLKDTVKTARSGGYKWRPGFLSERSVRLIDTLPENVRKGYFFAHGGDPSRLFSYDTLLRRLKGTLRDVAGMEDWNDYAIHNFRHTFMTRIRSTIDEPTMLKLMGHTRYRSEYDHSSAMQRFKELEGVRDLIPGIV